MLEVGAGMTRASDWFTTEADFRQLCGDAQSQAFSERAQEFANTMVVKAKEYGLSTLLSEPQLNWLCELGDWVKPIRIVR